jgi:arylsulfatase A-like enzyme
MRAVFVLFDSLNRHLLEPYGGTRIPTPNFTRLAARATTFDRHYVGSLPCMPARRDLQTGRLSFLHRSWGPLEPFDDSFPMLLFQNGIYSHLITDHAHYFEDGGATYHTRYDTFEFVRGQEGDPWKAMVRPPWERLREMYHPHQYSEARRSYYARHMINREFIREEEGFPSARCFTHGCEFLNTNRTADGWFVQIETFDPHEPFYAPPRFRERFPTAWNGPIRDWPRYGKVDELPEECEELRANYYALVAFCDALLGKLLDEFDSHQLWDNTALIVSTDHGFLLGEHDFWAKNRMSLYEEISHIPLFVHHPDFGTPGARSSTLTQTMDLATTFLDIFGVAAPETMQAHSLLPILQGQALDRSGIIFGYFGGAVNVTDGRFVYHRYPCDLAAQSIFQYTLMPQHIWAPFSLEELRQAQLAPPMPFTKNTPVLKIPMLHTSPIYNNYGPGALLENETRLYDLAVDPGQVQPLSDVTQERRMAELMYQLMRAAHAPEEAFVRLALAA